jgi:spore coat protein U-like protein
MKRVSRLWKIVVPAAVVLGFASSASAQGSNSANLAVSATVVSNCTITTSALAFGNYDPAGAHAATDLPGTGTVTIACTQGATATIGLGLGANASGSTRRMTNGSDFLTYELYQDVGLATIWTNGGAGLLSPAAAPSIAARNFTVFGNVPQAQDVSTGSYSDTVVATVNF